MQQLSSFKLGNAPLHSPKNAANFPPGLYLVATPIGNLSDLTQRAIEALKCVDIILCEDTRHTGKLLSHLGIQNNKDSYNDHNKERKISGWIKLLQEGKSLAVVCDAGTPGIADPGFLLSREAKRNNIPVIPIPGASALLCGVTASGLPTDKVMFMNFPPKKSSQRKKLFEDLKTRLSDAAWAPTLCFYISPYQLIKVLNELLEVYGNELIISLGRELTKAHEEFLTGFPQELLEYYKTRNPKGEYVLMYHSANKGELIEISNE